MKSKPQTYIFISRSGGGKGTQVALLEQYIKDNDLGEVFHLEAGDRFRNFFKKDTYTSNLAKEVTGKAELIEGLKKDHILVIDGNPRKIEEANLLDEAFKFYERDRVKVILIDVSRDWAIQRMKERKRADDKDLSSRTKRLEWYETDVKKVIEFFEKNKKYDVIKINGEQEIDDVHREILEKLEL
jgi:adenylate kinase family enzyme